MEHVRAETTVVKVGIQGAKFKEALTLRVVLCGLAPRGKCLLVYSVLGFPLASPGLGPALNPTAGTLDFTKYKEEAFQEMRYRIFLS